LSTNVLIIDDNSIDRDLFRRMLESQSSRFRCIEGEHGEAGLEQFHLLRPDCIILDLNLPDIDGLDLLRALLEGPDQCPVIVMTAYGSEQVAVEAMKGGAADYIVKGSVRGDALAHTIDNAMEKWALRRQVDQQRAALEERNRDLELALERECRARRAVEESENRYRTLAEALPQVVWTAAHPFGDLDYVNERWVEITGKPAPDAMGQGWLRFVSPEDLPRVQEAWRGSLARAAPLELECRLRTADGTFRWQLLRSLPVMQDGWPSKWLGTLTDVEDRKRAEQLLHHRQKLESIGILAGGVAHDFNNLLVAIVGGVSYALEVLPEDHELRPLLEGALKAGDRAAHLTRQMLAYAGKGRFLVESVDLSQILQSTCELLQASISKSIDLNLLHRPHLPRVLADASQLQQVIMNLIINAAEAIPQGRQGLIIASTGVERIEWARSTWSADIKPGEYVVLEVRDNGCGIDPAVLHQIFDPFFTTKFHGRGLGLAAVHGILRSNHGAITVESERGKGSTFRVLLPATAESGTRAVALEKVAAVSQPGARVLVVDDEILVRRTAQNALERAGYAVKVVAGGQEALDVLAGSGDGFSAVLLDLSMPGMDGEVTLAAIRRTHPDLPVVICSGYSEDEVQHRFAGKAVQGFLQKPFTSRAVREAVANLISVAHR
jgi:PAS domain S-box-containing protein